MSQSAVTNELSPTPTPMIISNKKAMLSQRWPRDAPYI